MSSQHISTEERRGFRVNGMVQGVGFRPFVYRQAVGYGLKGFTRNTASGLLIEVQGPVALLEEFSRCLQGELPPLAYIEAIEESTLACVAEDGFLIGDSSSGDGVETLIPPDMALCSDCRRELLDPANRRYHYPFINCTNCGPRYTIVGQLPYDRPFTSMHGFTMCRECEQEYHDPLDRRFHAQPNACPVCGPSLTLLDGGGVQMRSRGEAEFDLTPVHGEPKIIPDSSQPQVVDGEAEFHNSFVSVQSDVWREHGLPLRGDVAAEAVELLKQGLIVALKGLGGFHLAVDAHNEDAVRRLRERKGREAKPFAVMMRDLELVRRYCEVSEGELAALTSAQAPIVLLKKKKSAAPALPVAPGNERLGVMLPYTPLHTLLFDEGLDVLVMTSANFSEEPIASENEEALLRLKGIADAFLVHNRPIWLKCDDSVTIHLSGELRQIRRSRGYVPAPIYLREGGPTVLGTGGELKNTITLLKGTHALMSQHLGDMKNFDSYRHFEQVVAHLQHLFQATPELVVHDLHPGYMTTQWAMKLNIQLLGVQHHHAHLAACLAENREEGPAIGLILDGTGYGTDGTIWGGEVLIGDAAGVERFASLELMPLPGGESAVMQPWRTAIGYLHRSCADLPDLPFMKERVIAPVLELLEKRVNIVETSSCGRLFDAVAALCNLRGEITYEGEAAIALMHEAGGRAGCKAFRCELRYEKGQALAYRDAASGTTGNNRAVPGEKGRWVMLVSPIIQDVVAALQKGMAISEISQRFHRTLVICFHQIIDKASEATGLKTVALSGGVFQNEILFEALVSELQAAGYKVLIHALVPSNDGGISLGQAVIGRKYLNGNYYGVK
jgi:hydrogenase maturation protein HypF